MSNEILIAQTDPWHAIVIADELKKNNYGDVVIVDDEVGFREVVDRHGTSGNLPMSLAVLDRMLVFWNAIKRGEAMPPELEREVMQASAFDGGARCYGYLRKAEKMAGIGREHGETPRRRRTPAIFFTTFDRYDILESITRECGRRAASMEGRHSHWQYVEKVTRGTDGSDQPNYMGLHTAVQRALRYK